MLQVTGFNFFHMFFTANAITTLSRWIMIEYLVIVAIFSIIVRLYIVLCDVQPQSMSEYNSKEYSQSRYARSKSAPERFNKKESKERKRKQIEKLVKRVEVRNRLRCENIPHSLADITVASFVSDLTSYIEKVNSTNSELKNIVNHAENIGIFIYDLSRSTTMSDILVSVVSYMKCYVHTSLSLLIAELANSYSFCKTVCDGNMDKYNDEIAIEQITNMRINDYNKMYADTYGPMSEDRKHEVAEEERVKWMNSEFANQPKVCKAHNELGKAAANLFVSGVSAAHASYVNKYEADKSMSHDAEDITPFGDLDESIIPHAFSARDISDFWEAIKSNAIFPKIAFLISVALSSSVCAMKEINFDIAGVNLIHIEAMQKQCESTDLIDAILSTFTWIVETGSICLSERSLAPMLYDDQRLRLYTQKCTEVLSLASSVQAGNIPDLQLYERKLDDCMLETKRLQDVTKNIAVKELLCRKYVSLQNIKVDIINKRRNTQYRFAPMGISIFGGSSIGKSDIAELTMKVGLEAMGEDSSKRGIVTLNEADKYDSTYTSDIKGVFIDDANNANSQFVETAPTQKYIQFFNNVAAQAVKADLESKGNVFIDFKVGVLTTNTKTLGAQVYSNYPVAVLRRFIHVTASVKTKYCVPGGTSLNILHPDLINAKPTDIIDVWNFDIEEVVPDGSTMGQFRIMSYVNNQGKTIRCKNISLSEYLEAIAVFARTHKVRQDKQVKRNVALESITCCKQCGVIPSFCKCVNPQAGSEITSIMNFLFSCLRPMFVAYIQKCVSYLVNAFVFSKYTPDGAINQFLVSLYLNNTAHCRVIPRWIFGENTRDIIFDYNVNKYYPNIKNIHRLSMICLIALCCIFLLGYRVFTIYTLLWLLIAILLLSLVIFCCEANFDNEERYVAEVVEQNDFVALQQYQRALQINWQRVGLTSAALLATTVLALQMWNLYRKKPHTLSDPKTFDLKPSWFGYMMGNTKVNHCESNVVGATVQHAIDSVSSNLCWGRFYLDNGHVNKCCVFFPRKSIMLFPRHTFYVNSNMTTTNSKVMRCEIFRHNKPGGKFEVCVNWESCYHYPECDMVAAFVPNSPDFGNKVKWFTKEFPTGTCMAQLTVADAQCIKTTHPISMTFGKISHRYMSMMGAGYKTSLAQEGACMGPIISDTKNPAVVGFHIGGNNISYTGVSMTVTKSMLDDAIAWLDSNVGYVSADASELPHTIMERPVIMSPVPHAKAKAIHELTSDDVVEVLGATQLRSEQTSEVIPSILSEHVDVVCGVPNKWGSPKLRPNWQAFNTNLEYIAKPGRMFDPMLLQRAVDDYMSELIPLISPYVEWNDFRPLTMKESILGIAEVKFIDAMPMNTGIGFPLFGKKNKQTPDGQFIHFDEIRDGEILIDRIPKQHILDEYNRMLSCYKLNQRAYPVTSATLKDEPTLLDKEKVRVFQAAPVALGLLIRKYFLPVARFLCLHPLQSESAVGVNAFSPDWQELMDYATKYSHENDMLAWDYSKYDVRMNSQMTRKVWEIFIRIAEFGGYDNESIGVMKAMIVDITHPVIDMNGTLLMCTSMNTSGNNMTVYVNSLAGSLYVRMGFFSIYPNHQRFRDYVALLTYGDDAIGSTRQETRGFNFISYKKFLEQHGMKLTLPSKTEEEVEFLKFSDTDFLKRKSNFIPELNISLGMLEEDSIWKSLHRNLRSRSATPTEVACSCVETALHEWFAYGRDHYELRRGQMQEVCKRANIASRALDITFDERVEFWHEKYKNSGS